MHPLIAAHKPEVAGLCRRFHVRRLEVFGSAVRDDFDPDRSDLDLLVEFEPVEQLRGRQYAEFKEALEDLFRRRVDLVEATALRNPYLKAAIERSKEPFYGA